MQNRARWLLGLVVSLLIGGAANAQTDWPRFMGPTGDGVWSDKGLVDEFPDGGPKVEWRIPVGPGYSGPAVANGRLFLTDRTQDDGQGRSVENSIRKVGQIPGGERVVCVDAATGKEIWSHQYDCPYEIAYPTGPRSTPTVDGDHVYTLGAMGRLICFKTDDGSVVWEKDLTAEYNTKAPPWGYASHPLVVGESVCVAVGGKGSGVVAFDRKTGNELWKSVSTFDIAYAPLVLFDQANEPQLIFWHAESIDSLDPKTGEVFWSVKFPKERNASQTSVSMPRLIGNQLLVTEYYKGSVLLEIGSHPPAVTEKWRSFEKDPRNRSSLNSLMTTPVVKGDYAYGIASGTRDAGVFRCIQLSTGEEVWTETDWMAPKPAVFATAFIVENGDRYFLFNDIGELMIVKLTPDGFEELDRADVLEPTGVARGRDVVWCQPACAGGRMFIRNDKELVCLDLRTETDGDSNR